jgi:hypothetical protein
VEALAQWGDCWKSFRFAGRSRCRFTGRSKGCTLAGNTTVENRTSVIDIDHVVKSFGDFVAVEDAHVSIAQGEFFSMLGP